MRHRILQAATDLRWAMWTSRVQSRKEQRMSDTERQSTCTVRVTVKLRPYEYDELLRHVREIGSTMSAFFRESAVSAMEEKHPDMALSHTPPRCGA